MADRPDPSSFSRPDVVRVTKLHLDWLVDFDRKVISGTATLTIQRVQPDARQLVLDSRDLTLLKVEEGRKEGRLLEFSVGEKHPIYGSPITVSLLEPPEAEGEDVVRVTYETSPSSTALQWLAAGQTADGASPLLFSQCQAIHGRSLAPLQDAPAVKGPYSATVLVPRGLVALMSALRGAATDHAQGTSYQFSQPVPVPAYLLAVVVGRLDSATLGPRVTVWAEPSVLPRAATEFQETEVALEAAERLCGPYVWGHYGLVVLPPSFPYGGMENPCLTFVTPTLLAGDKSAVDVVIHEISHSWTGNLVTNRTWGDFWLNEGMTMLVQRKIEGALHGLPTRHFSAILGWKSLVDCLNKLPLPNLLAQACGELAKKWESWEGEDEGPDFPFSPKDLDAFSSQQIVEFLAQLPPLPARKLSAMERHYGMFARTNCEIRSQWLRLALKARWEEAVGPALDFVTQQGRMKYTRPIYRELYAWGPPVRERAVAHFLEHEASMMHVSAHSLRGDLHLPSPSHS
ncbi:leukotriene A-4 hydrolase [Hyalella azteca]|uniref:Leukotriene A-4 hydrolase n=1 Tax=Hyalella azteca TaxID=294128 RepID=A0A979FMV2_HYAAZ|nr:leukotriene A-4 hydrolase [Hyalella azteca]